MSKLYIDIDYKDKNELRGSIYNRPRKKNQACIYLRYKATRLSDTTFQLDLYKYPIKGYITVILDETFECRMTANNILFYVDQRIEHILKQLR